MTELKRMIEDMQLHGYAERTRKSYADAVKGLARHLDIRYKPFLLSKCPYIVI